MKRVHFSLALPKWHEWLVYFSAGLLSASGIAWLLLDRFGEVQGEFGPEQSSALPWLLLGHGVLAYVFAIAAAMLLPVHVRLGWNAGRNRKSGLSLLVIALFLTISGLALYYASAEDLRSIASTAHWLVGIALPLLLIVHLVRGKRSRDVEKLRR
jgi:hypothetical protein